MDKFFVKLRNRRLFNFREEDVNVSLSKIWNDLFNQIVNAAHHLFMLSLLAFPDKLHSLIVKELLAMFCQKFNNRP